MLANMTTMISVLVSIFILLTVSVSAESTTTTYSLPNSEYLALYDLYNSTNGQQWKWSKPYSTYGYPWDFSNNANPCSSTSPWQGLTCTNDCANKPCYLETLQLSDYLLSGTIPSSIGNLQMLTLLDLSANNLNGTIPFSLGNLISLQNLKLYSNHLTGSLPQSIGNLNSVTLFAVNENTLSGSLPSTFGNMTSLINLYLYTNRITGSLPPSIGNLQHLVGLYIYSNFLSGSLPNSIGNLVNLIDFYGYSNQLTGSIPSSIGNLNKLQELILYNIPFLSGTLPSTIGNLRAIEVFILYYNQISGSLPSSLGNLNNVNDLEIYYNLLTGSIPDSLGNLGSIVDLDLFSNFINGSLPTSLSQLSTLESIDLHSNMLTGVIPQSYEKLGKVQSIQLYTNFLTGSIPSSLGKLNRLEVLLLSSNQFNGTIPSSMGDLSRLRYLELKENLLTGSIPVTFGNLTNLMDLYLDTNQLTGPIPATIGNLINLVEFIAYSNRLTGTIPSILGNLSNLGSFVVYSNNFHGTIPSSLGYAKSLIDLQLNENKLTGTIPSSIDKLSSLVYLYLYSNYLTGTIPNGIGNLQSLQYCILNNNQFHGTIPTTFTNIRSLVDLDVSGNIFTGLLPEFNSLAYYSMQSLVFSSNQFSGTIPISLGYLPFLLELYLDGNQLTGMIPVSFNSSRILRQSYLNTNYLSGSLPENMDWKYMQILYLYNNVLWGKWLEEVYQFKALKSIDLSNNVISGSIASEVFSNATYLQSVNLNNNQLTGTLPDSMFTTSSNLTSIVLVSNCFTGTLPKVICHSSALEQLILDGLHSASSCINHALPFLPNSGIVSSNSVHGQIPACLFQQQSLSVLHLGGNALTGSIETDVVTGTLTELILSSNALTGTVPSALWHSNIISLDLSFNRLTGSLSSTMLPAISSQNNINNFTVNLNNNQFSGTVPEQLVHLPANHVNVLDGNIFSCNAQRSDIPQNDPKYDSYNCGSDSTNYALIGFGVGCLCLAIGVVFESTWRAAFLNMMTVSMLTTSTNISMMLYTIQQFVIKFGLPSIFVGMLMFGLLSISYSSYFESYIWTISAVYKNGIVPSVLMLVWLLLLLIIASSLLRKFYNLNQKDVEDIQATTNPVITLGRVAHQLKSNWMTYLIVVGVVTIVIIVNGAYVSAVDANYTYQQLILIAFGLSLFKAMVNFSTIRLSPFIGQKALVGLCLFNNLVAPFLAEMFVSSDCFLYIVTQQPTLSYTYHVYSCPAIVAGVNNVPCDFQVAVEKGFGTTEVLSLSPPFHYSYQCSFSLISSYAYVFIFRYILSGLIFPFMIWLLRSVSVLCHSTKIQVVLEQLVPVLWRRHHAFQDESSISAYLQALDRYVSSYLGPHFVVNMVTDLSILVCFGAIFPPLALVVALSIWKDTIQVKLILQRINDLQTQYMKNESVIMQITAINTHIQAAYTSSESDIRYGVWCGLCISGFVWAFVLSDMLMASTGTTNSIWIAIAMIMGPFVLWIVESRLDHDHINRRDSTSVEKKENKESFASTVENPIIVFGTDITRDSLASNKRKSVAVVVSDDDDSEIL